MERKRRKCFIESFPCNLLWRFGRIRWVCKVHPFGSDVLTSRGSSRKICLFDGVSDAPVQRITLDNSPAPLVPHYDYDTKLCPHGTLLILVFYFSGQKDRDRFMHIILLHQRLKLPFFPPLIPQISKMQLPSFLNQSWT